MREERGITLILVLIVIIILTIIGGAVLFLIQANIEAGGSLRKKKESFYLAEAGVNNAISVLKTYYHVDDEDDFTSLLTRAFNTGWTKVNGRGDASPDGDWFLIPELSNFNFRGGSYKVFIKDDEDENPPDPYVDNNSVILVRSLGEGPDGSSTLLEVELEIVH